MSVLRGTSKQSERCVRCLVPTRLCTVMLWAPPLTPKPCPSPTPPPHPPPPWVALPACAANMRGSSGSLSAVYSTNCAHFITLTLAAGRPLAMPIHKQDAAGPLDALGTGTELSTAQHFQSFWPWSPLYFGPDTSGCSNASTDLCDLDAGPNSVLGDRPTGVTLELQLTALEYAVSCRQGRCWTLVQYRQLRTRGRVRLGL